MINIPYKVITTTSDISYASTDSKVYLQIIGRKRETEKIPLKKSIEHKNPFEQGNKDSFEFIAPDVGEIKRIKWVFLVNCIQWRSQNQKSHGINSAFQIFDVMFIKHLFSKILM